MEVKFALGTSVDIATKGELDAGLGSLADRILGETKRPRPMWLPLTRSGQMPSSGPLVLDFEFPPAGRAWNLLGVTTFGSDDATTVANAKVAIYCGTPGPTGLGLAQLKIPALAVPTFITITKDVVWAVRTENIIANVTGATAGTQVGVTVHLAEWRETEIYADSGR